MILLYFVSVCFHIRKFVLCELEVVCYNDCRTNELLWEGVTAMQVRMTYKYRLYDNKQNAHLDRAIDIAAEIWNHCIALHRRYYRMYGKHLSTNRLKVFLTKLKRREKYAYWNLLGSQAIQDVVERIGRSYDAFFIHVKEDMVVKLPQSFVKKQTISLLP